MMPAFWKETDVTGEQSPAGLGVQPNACLVSVTGFGVQP